MTVIPLKKPENIKPQQSPGEKAMLRLIDMTNGTCLIALDKTLNAITRSSLSYCAAAARCGSIAERITRASYEVGGCLPPEQRCDYAGKK